MPTCAAEILRRAGDSRPASDVRLTDAEWRNATARTLVKGPALWPRLEIQPAPDAAVETAVTDPIVPGPPRHLTHLAHLSHPAHLPHPPHRSHPAPHLPHLAHRDKPAEVSIDQFMSIELRVAKVLTAERVPKSKKLMQLRIDAGTEERTIVAGIAEAYEPDALVGRLIVIVANLKPAKLMGIESNGMVLAASGADGKPVLRGAGTRVDARHARALTRPHSSLVIRHSVIRHDRLPLSPGGRDLRGRSRSTSSAARREAGPDGRDVHPRGRRHRRSARAPSACAASGIASASPLACTRTRRTSAQGSRAGPTGCCATPRRRSRRCARSARSAWTTTTTTRRGTCSTRCSPSSSPPHARWRCPSSSTRARRTTTRSRCWRARAAALRGVFHCFTGGVARARRALDLGFYLSLAGIVTFPKATDLREVAAYCPDDRLLVETDSPFLAPVPHRGKRNEPAFVARVVEELAGIRGWTPTDRGRADHGEFRRAVRPETSRQRVDTRRADMLRSTRLEPVRR